jgi:hypothetical protein
VKRKFDGRLRTQCVDSSADGIASVVRGDAFTGRRRPGEERLDGAEFLEESIFVGHAPDDHASAPMVQARAREVHTARARAA